MKKIALVFPKAKDIEPEKIEFEGKEILVENHLSLDDQQIIIGAYLHVYFHGENGYFSDVKADYFGAEAAFDMAVLDLATNIKVDAKGFNMDLAYEYGLVSMVKSKIKNIEHVREILERSVSDAKEEKNSLLGIISSIPEMINGIDPEKIKELGDAVKDLEVLAEDSPLSGLLKEGV